MNDEIILSVKNLSIEYTADRGQVHAVTGVSFDIHRGEFFGLAGESGCGKSTMAYAVMQLLKSGAKIVDGTISFKGKNLLDLSSGEMRQFRWEKTSMVLQSAMNNLNPVVTIGSQLSDAILAHEDIPVKDAMDRARSLLELVNIDPERVNAYPHELSGGMKQRVVIAIALACSPGLLIADEPTTALDVTIQAQVLEMMKNLKEQYNTSMLMITHDLGIVAEICDTVSIIYAGRIVEHGTLEDVFDYTRHPYTEGLFNSLPDLDHREQRLKPIKGLMPDPANLPAGCAFCPRCDYAMEICKTQKPKRVYRNEEHYVECHLYNEENIKEGMLNRK